MLCFRLKLVALFVLMISLATPAQARGHHRGHGAPWCGLWMMGATGKTDRGLALARNWAREGSNAGGPGIGVIAVWPHHVGRIDGQGPSGGWIVTSGNDGGRVRTRELSLAGVIAFRRL